MALQCRLHAIRATIFVLVSFVAYTAAIRTQFDPLSGPEGKLPPLQKPLPAPACERLECPPYTLVHEDPKFEIRKYALGRFVQAGPLADVSFLSATKRGFHKLFQYIEGANLNDTKVPMTAPVVTTVMPSAGPFCSSAFAVRFPVPEKFEHSPPVPLPELQLTVVNTPARCVAVRKFSGFAKDDNIAEEAAELATSLEGTKWAAAAEGEREEGQESYSIAQYEPIPVFRHRHNEVWVPLSLSGAEVENDCSPASPIKKLEFQLSTLGNRFETLLNWVGRS